MNRKYPNLNDDTLLHIACREGYLRMVQFITDTKNQPQFENTELDVDVDNGKWRTPASRMSTEGGLHSNASSPGEEAVGSFFD